MERNSETETKRGGSKWTEDKINERGRKGKKCKTM
jgi:hypothetical protein